MRTLVVGAGVSGRAAAALARHLGDDVLVYDRRPEAVAGLAGSHAVAAGGWSAELLDRVDRVVASPGVPERAPELRDALAAGIPVVSEIELGASVLKARLVAVTGTNGKTTVTNLIAEMLLADDRKAVAAGNIGTALSDVATDTWDVVVVEASSFQLRFIDRFHPSVAVLLNIAPDHLDWHGSMDAYIAAKSNLFRNQEPTDVLIYDIDDPGARRGVAGARSRLLPISGRAVPEAGIGPDGGHLVLSGGRLELGVSWDPAFLADLAAAAAAAEAAGVRLDAIQEVIARFQPGPHRRTLVRTRGRVEWVNDSKATNPHAALASINAFSSVILVAGGRNKGLDLEPLATAPNVREVIAIGEAADEIQAAQPRAIAVDSIEEAVRVADGLARPGDTVLLAPGCASFDMFDSYAARGEAFAAAVDQLDEEVGSW